MDGRRTPKHTAYSSFMTDGTPPDVQRIMDINDLEEPGAGAKVDKDANEYFLVHGQGGVMRLATKKAIDPTGIFHVLDKAADPEGYKLKKIPLMGSVMKTAVGDLKLGQALKGLAFLGTLAHTDIGSKVSEYTAYTKSALSSAASQLTSNPGLALAAGALVGGAYIANKLWNDSAPDTEASSTPAESKGMFVYNKDTGMVSMLGSGFDPTLYNIRDPSEYYELCSIEEFHSRFGGLSGASTGACASASTAETKASAGILSGSDTEESRGRAMRPRQPATDLRNSGGWSTKIRPPNHGPHRPL